MQGDLVRATTLYEEALAVARAMGMTFGVAMIMTMLGHLARQQQNYALAKARYREGLTLLRAFDSPTYTGLVPGGLRRSFCAEEYYVQADEALCGGGGTARTGTDPVPLTEREAFEQIVAVAKSRLTS